MRKMRNIHDVLKNINRLINRFLIDVPNEKLKYINKLTNIENDIRYMAPELVWDYVYNEFVANFVPPESELEYKILSIWTTKSVEELKNMEDK